MEKLSDAEMYAWNFLEDNKSKVQRSSITQIAEEGHVSTATIVRSLKKRGFEGFSDYKNQLKRENMTDKRGEVRGLSKEANAFVYKNIDEVTRTINLLDAQDLTAVLANLTRAKTIMVIARGPSTGVADDLTHRLQSLGKNAVSRYYDSMMDYADKLTADDMVIALSSSGNTARLIAAVKKAQKQGARVLTITCNYQSELAQLSDLLLLAYKSKLEKSALLGDAASRMTLELVCRILLDLYAIFEEKGTISD
ncbi:MurR/RpiR family transcriptional regulator [Lactococcus kimchii]|uniref:MurR/RpiR family transcriptional regulator n=1 Tax=Lactococcus sp. S-13 TaxID=2507158 RepID=UPI0010239CA9|nr:MurR/RpiR family transcriptional regulator [Lactococcus sp. S-13]RZI48407.1 MurR/RpiR family transcriptional regulator [Lactococcus sp. S-13]